MRIIEIPMVAIYGQEISQLKIWQNIPLFVRHSTRNTLKRIWTRYCLMEFSIASLELLLGLPLVFFGLALGIYWWVFDATQGSVASPGKVMLPSLCILIGTQLIFSFLAYDIQSEPDNALYPRIAE